jgi:hypothetical protein
MNGRCTCLLAYLHYDCFHLLTDDDDDDDDDDGAGWLGSLSAWL